MHQPSVPYFIHLSYEYLRWDILDGEYSSLLSVGAEPVARISMGNAAFIECLSQGVQAVSASSGAKFVYLSSESWRLLFTRLWAYVYQ